MLDVPDDKNTGPKVPNERTFRFMDLTDVSSSAQDVGFISDELLNNINRDRLGFYKNFLHSLTDKKKAKAMFDAFGVENRTLEQRQRIEERISNILAKVKYLDRLSVAQPRATGGAPPVGGPEAAAATAAATVASVATASLGAENQGAEVAKVPEGAEDKGVAKGKTDNEDAKQVPPAPGAEGRELGVKAPEAEMKPIQTKEILEDTNRNIRQNVGDLSELFSRNPMLSKDYKVETLADFVTEYLGKGDPEKATLRQKYNLSETEMGQLIRHAQETGTVERLMTGGSAFTEALARLMETNNDLKKERDEIILYENDPLISPDSTRITMTDRVIFIAVTYIIRSLSLFVVEWGVGSQMLLTFQSTFNFYLMVYLTIFVLWVLLANASEKEVFFRTLFYYVSVTPHGYGRIAAHILVQLLVLPIPLVVSDPKRRDPVGGYTFERRRALISVISQFTMIIWVFTSAIALSY